MTQTATPMAQAPAAAPASTPAASATKDAAPIVPKKQAYLETMFQFSGAPEVDLALIETRYGPSMAIYAVVNARLFYIQRKYSELFAGPFAQHIQCCGIMPELLVHGIKMEPILSCTMNPGKYYVDLFKVDSSSIKVRNTVNNPRNESITEPIMRIFRTLQVTCTTPPEAGRPAFATRAEFDRLLEKVLTRYDGTRDEALREVINNAGVLPAAPTGTDPSFDGWTLLERAKHNYCISGGFISRLIDPCATVASFAGADVDIFVYGEHQEATIDDLVARLFVPGQTYITIRGSVVSIYRVDGFKVQIVSSLYSEPCNIIADFDFAHVMAYWSNGTVYANALCLRAFATRTCTGKHSLDRHPETRIIKLLHRGFKLRLGKNERRNAQIIHTFEDTKSLLNCALDYIDHIDIRREMSPPSIIARIMHHDNVLDVVTNVATTVTTGIAPSVSTSSASASTSSACASTSSASASTSSAAGVSLAAMAQTSGGIASALVSQPATIVSSAMLLRHRISGYATMDLCDVDWKSVNPTTFPTTVGTKSPIYIAGLQARITVETYGRTPLSRKEGDERVLLILSQNSSTAFMKIIKGINDKLLANGQKALQTDVTDDGLVRITAICTTHPRWQKNPHSATASVVLSLFVKCISENTLELIIETPV